MLLQWIATLSPQTRWCGTVGVLAVLASAFARFSARFASRSNVESDSKRKQQQAFDSKLCDVFWGFRPAAARDDMFTRIKWFQLGCYVVLFFSVVFAVIFYDPIMGGITLSVVLISGSMTAWKQYHLPREELGSELPDRGERAKLPVTIITGFLGAGKTTLVNRILHNRKGRHILVIENELGEVAVDNQLLVQALDDTAEIITLNNGCVCCKVRKDLVLTVKTMLKQDTSFNVEHIIIETTGVADPAPVVQMFYMDEEIRSRCELDSVLCVVDPKHLALHLGDTGGECARQVAFADHILMNKIDLVSETELQAVEKQCSEINAGATFTRCQNADVDIDWVLSLHAFDPEQAAAKAEILQVMQGHSHFGTVSLKFDKDFDLVKLNRALGQLLTENGADIFRCKGIVAIQNDPRKFVFQGVHMIFNGQPAEDWPEGDARKSVLVFIGKKLNREQLQTRFEQCHEPDASDGFVGLGEGKLPNFTIAADQK